jgi:hypothetical protein
MIAIDEIKMNDLVESFTFGFGRVVEIFETGGFAVKYPHREKEVIYSTDNIKNITIHKD